MPRNITLSTGGEGGGQATMFAVSLGTELDLGLGLMSLGLINVIAMRLSLQQAPQLLQEPSQR